MVLQCVTEINNESPHRNGNFSTSKILRKVNKKLWKIMEIKLVEMNFYSNFILRDSNFT